jgi:hypothetical protein
MRIYNLIIAYNEDTDEVEYIQESLEDDSNDDCLLNKMVKEGYKDSISISIIEQLEDIAKS